MTQRAEELTAETVERAKATGSALNPPVITAKVESLLTEEGELEEFQSHLEVLTIEEQLAKLCTLWPDDDEGRMAYRLRELADYTTHERAEFWAKWGASWAGFVVGRGPVIEGLVVDVLDYPDEWMCSEEEWEQMRGEQLEDVGSEQ